MGDARYLRLQELSLAYNLKVPALQRILGINSMNIQLMCENLAVWDSVKIFDPEQADLLWTGLSFACTLFIAALFEFLILYVNLIEISP